MRHGVDESVCRPEAREAGVVLAFHGITPRVEQTRLAERQAQVGSAPARRHVNGTVGQGVEAGHEVFGRCRAHGVGKGVRGHLPQLAQRGFVRQTRQASHVRQKASGLLAYCAGIDAGADRFQLLVCCLHELGVAHMRKFAHGQMGDDGDYGQHGDKLNERKGPLRTFHRFSSPSSMSLRVRKRTKSSPRARRSSPSMRPA